MLSNGSAVMQFVHHKCRMTQHVRKTIPFTAREDEQIQAFSQADSWEHQALERLSPVPLRQGSGGGVVRALALLGMAYVREHAALADDLATGYAELASDRAKAGSTAEAARTSGMRSNMTRRARPGSATRAG